MKTQTNQITKDILYLASATLIVASGCFFAEGKMAQSAIAFVGAAATAASLDYRGNSKK